MLSKPIYELMPYACIGSGGIGILSIDNLMGLTAGAILYVLGSLIWTMRFHIRHPVKTKFSRRGKTLSQDVYEFKPFILLALALVLLVFYSNTLVFISSLVIVTYSFYIVFMRVHCRY